MRQIFTLLLTFLIISFISAQPPCLPTTGGIPAGNSAPGCTLCEPIYQGSTDGHTANAPGSARFSCGSIENNQFISIVADISGNISATILASNCQNFGGIEMVIYDTDFNEVSNCALSGGFNGGPGNLQADNLTPGEIYWIMVDGVDGDICDILITTAGGVNTGPPDPPGPMTANPDTSPLCPGAVVCYSIAPVANASQYEWVLPGNAIIVSGGGSSDTTICIEYIAAGGGVLRVTPSNPCFQGIPALTPVVVLSILPTLLPPEFVCPGDQAGSYEVTYTNALGCDSVVTFVFLPLIQIPKVINATICSEDCFMVGDSCYNSPGGQTISLGPPYNQANGCDSIVILSLNLLSPQGFLQENICPGECFIYGDSCYFSSTLIPLADTSALGCDSTLSLNLITSDTTPPTINCSISPTINAISLNWSSPTGANEFQVFINDSLYSTLSDTSYLYVPNLGNDSLIIEIQPSNSIGCNFQSGFLTCVISDITAVKNTLPDESIKVFPNPNQGVFNVETDFSIIKTIIYSSSGKLLEISTERQVDISELPAGVYLLKIMTDEGILVKKVMKF